MVKKHYLHISIPRTSFLMSFIYSCISSSEANPASAATPSKAFPIESPYFLYIRDNAKWRFGQ